MQREGRGAGGGGGMVEEMWFVMAVHGGYRGRAGLKRVGGGGGGGHEEPHRQWFILDNSRGLSGSTYMDNTSTA